MLLPRVTNPPPIRPFDVACYSKKTRSALGTSRRIYKEVLLIPVLVNKALSERLELFYAAVA